MKKLPNIFKPEINHYLNNNKEVYYSFLEDKTSLNLKKAKSPQIKNDSTRVSKKLNSADFFNKRVLIKTNENDYKTEILSKMGNNIIISNGKVISIFDIISIEKI